MGPILFRLEGGAYLVIRHQFFVTLNPGVPPQGGDVERVALHFENIARELRTMALQCGDTK